MITDIFDIIDNSTIKLISMAEYKLPTSSFQASDSATTYSKSKPIIKKSKFEIHPPLPSLKWFSTKIVSLNMNNQWRK